MKVTARLIDMEGVTWGERTIHCGDEWLGIPNHLDVPLRERLTAVPLPVSTDYPGIRVARFHLRAVVGPDDGGPLAIYRRLAAWV